jgi:hypothetical protein
VLTETYRAEPSPSGPRFEFTGTLTKAENRRWIIWQVFRQAFRRYVIWIGGWVGLTAVILAINHDKPLPSFIGMLHALAMLHVLFFGYFLFLFARGVGVAARYKPAKIDSTVRFFDDKVEVVAQQKYTQQFPVGVLRLRQTGFGIVCESTRGVQIFLLPRRVLTGQHFKEIPQLYTAAGPD